MRTLTGHEKFPDWQSMLRAEKTAAWFIPLVK